MCDKSTETESQPESAVADCPNCGSESPSVVATDGTVVYCCAKCVMAFSEVLILRDGSQ